MLKEIVIAVDAYFRAHKFISEHRLWKWIVFPGILYTLMFCTGMYFFIISSNEAVTYITRITGTDHWLQQQRNAFLTFLFVMGGIMVRLILLFFYFSLFKYLFLIIGSPLFAYLSEKTEALLEGKDDFPFSFRQLLKDIVRGIQLSLRNTLWQTVYTVFILIFSFIPVIGWITPVFALLIECYYYGFSMLDYSSERHNLPPAASVAFVSKHRGLAIGNGLLFYIMHIVPLIGWVLAPAYAVIAATISIYYQKKQV